MTASLGVLRARCEAAQTARDVQTPEPPVAWLDSSNQAWNKATTALCAGVRCPGGSGSMNQ